MKRKSQFFALFMVLCMLASIAVLPVAADEVTPENPGTTTPENPGTTTPENPGTTTPENPGTTTPENPGTTTPENPGTTTPEKPGTTTPENPGTTTPEKPGTTTPENPGTTTPEKPGTTTPENPGTTTPENPGQTKPPVDPKPETPTRNNFTISPTSVDFGRIEKGTTSGLSKTVTINNTSSVAMTVNYSVERGSGFSISGFPSSVSAKSSASFTVTLNSTKNTGSSSESFTISAAYSSESFERTLSVSAEVVETGYTISLSPTSKDFGKLVEGYDEKTAKEKELTVTVTNKSDNTIRMSDVKGNDHFDVTATQSGTVSLKYNEDATYKIVPKKDLKAGSYTDKIVFQTREGATAEFKATLVVEKKEAALTLSPSTLDFGSAQQGYTALDFQRVTIKNNTDYPMTLEQPSSYNYEIGLLSNKSLPAGGTATFNIRPMTGLMANDYKGIITVRANGYSADLSVNFTVSVNLSVLAFLDVPNGYSLAADIAYVTQRGLMNGTGGGNFNPYGPMTRGQIVTILHRLAGQPVVTGDGFTDVAAGSYCETAVKWAAAIGITKGYEDGTFKPGDSITREQLATFLYRYATTRNLTTTLRADLSKFSDGDTVSAYARDALSWANGAGLVNGTGEGKLNPFGGATRAQAAAILHRFCENVAR